MELAGWSASPMYARRISGTTAFASRGMKENKISRLRICPEGERPGKNVRAATWPQFCRWRFGGLEAARASTWLRSCHRIQLFYKSRRAAGRPSGAACAKKGASGRMQRPPELVPIPEYLLGTSLVPPEGFGKLRKVTVAAFKKNPEKIGQNLATIQHHY